MRRIPVAILLALSLFAIGARPAISDFCDRRPTHPKCQPSATPSPTSTPAVTPSPTVRPTATPTPSAIPSSTPSPTATPIPTPPPTGPWTLVFNDQFSTDIPLGSFPDQSTKSGGPGSWSSYPHGWHDTSGNGSYDSDHVVSVSGGDLLKRLHYEGGEYKVAAITPILASGDWNQLYGRYEIRFRVPAPLPGYKIAWLLWPRSEVWPRDGEIDFPESDLNATSHIQGFMHRQGGTSGGDQDAYSTNVLTVGDWHTAIIEWRPNDLNFILDGTVIGHSTSRVPNTPMRWVIQTETRIGGGAPPQTTDGLVRIDYVKVWSYTP